MDTPELVDPQFTAVIFLSSAPEWVVELVLVPFFSTAGTYRPFPSKPQGPVQDRSCTGPLDGVETP